MEEICYYCKHCSLRNIPSDFRCQLTGESVETFNYCNKFEETDENV